MLGALAPASLDSYLRPVMELETPHRPARVHLDAADTR